MKFTKTVWKSREIDDVLYVFATLDRELAVAKLHTTEAYLSVEYIVKFRTTLIQRKIEKEMYIRH